MEGIENEKENKQGFHGLPGSDCDDGGNVGFGICAGRFSLTAKLAKGGTVLEPKLASGTYETDKYGEVPA